MPPRIHGSGLLDGFETLAQEIGVAIPQRDVVRKGGAGVEANGLADHESHGFGLGLADGLGSEGAAFSPVEHFVSDLMRQNGEFLGGLHPGKQGDLAALRQSLGGADLLGVAQFDASRFHKLDQPFAVARDLALDFGQLRKLFAFGLRDVKDVDGAEAVQLRLRVFLLSVLPCGLF